MATSTAELLDTLRLVETPEGVRLELRVAGPVSRGLAWGIDQLIRMALYSAIGGTLQALGGAGQGVLLIVIFVTEWFYPVFFEVLMDGQTPGKRALSLAVVHDDGRPVGWAASVLRNLLRGVDFFPVAYLVGLITMVTNSDFKRLGDWAAGTVVTYRSAPRTLQVSAEGDARPAGAPLTLREQRALVDYVARQEDWSDARRDELVGILAPQLRGRPEAADKEVRSIVHWLLGRR